MSRIRADRYTNREGTGAPTFSDGVNVVGVTSMSGDLAVTNGTITGPSQLTISGITSSISDTAVDVFVYDTSKDSDGGAWRKKTQDTSWYNETLNTATRGSRKEFPAVVVIVAEATQLTIYDGDDPDLSMWMVFNVSGAVGANSNMLPRGNSPSESDITSIACLNGRLAVGLKDVNGTVGEGLAVIDFISELARIHRGSASGYTGAIYSLPISGRNSNGLYRGDYNSLAIVAETCNDVAMAVLPNAPIDDTTGLPIPTLAVATDGGVSIVRDNGNVSNITYSSYVTIGVSFDKNNGLWLGYQVGTTAIGWYYYTSLETTSALPATGPNCNSGWSGSFNMIGGSNFTGLGYNYSDFTAGTVDRLHNFNGFGIVGAPTKLVNYISTTYNTGWIPGDIQIATLSDTDATSQTGGTIADRSVKANSLTVTGTITRTAVATGADLVGYSGYSNSNRLSNSSFAVNFGNPVTISISFWQKYTDTTDYGYAVALAASGSFLGGISNQITGGSTGQAYFNLGSVTLFSGNALNDGLWHCITGTIEKNVKKLYVDGELVSSTIINDYNMTAVDTINVGSYSATQYHHRGSIALVRVSKTVPSPEQVKKMYDDEKYLFQENSKATLYGSSDTVTALAHDDSTNILHVGTSSGRSDFQGLRRINNTTVGITSAISASNELVAEQ